MTQIDISEQDRIELAEFYKSKVDRLLKELASAQKNLAKLSGGANFVKIATNPINQSGQFNQIPSLGVTWQSRIDAALVALGKAATSSEILDVIIRSEPQLANNRLSAMKSLSSVLSVHSKGDNNKYIQEKIGASMLYSRK